MHKVANGIALWSMLAMAILAQSTAPQSTVVKLANAQGQSVGTATLPGPVTLTLPLTCAYH
jgi:hypothetical protein